MTPYTHAASGAIEAPLGGVTTAAVGRSLYAHACPALQLWDASGGSI
ncbi:hypothetical protein [Cypionkella sp. TWP1-2-1b2]